MLSVTTHAAIRSIEIIRIILFLTEVAFPLEIFILCECSLNIHTLIFCSVTYLSILFIVHLATHLYFKKQIYSRHTALTLEQAAKRLWSISTAAPTVLCDIFF